MRSDGENCKNSETIKNTEVKFGEYTVLYELVKSTADGFYPGEERDAYSIRSTLFENGEKTDEDFVYDITSENGTAEKIFSDIVSGGVTPVTLRDVIYDLTVSLLDDIN